MRTFLLGLATLMFFGCGAAPRPKTKTRTLLKCRGAASMVQDKDKACYFVEHPAPGVMDVFVVGPKGTRLPDTEWRAQETRIAKAYLGPKAVARSSTGLSQVDLDRLGADQGLVRRWKRHGERALTVCPRASTYPGWTCLTKSTVKTLQALPKDAVPDIRRWIFAALSATAAEGRNALKGLLPSRIGRTRVAWNCLYSEGRRRQPRHPSGKPTVAHMVSASCTVSRAR